jgi:hypothetical protein
VLHKPEIKINGFRQQIHIVYRVVWITLSSAFLSVTLFRKAKKNNFKLTAISNVFRFAKKFCVYNNICLGDK